MDAITTALDTTAISVAVIGLAFGFLSLIVTAIVAPILIARFRDKALLVAKEADAKTAREDKEAERQRIQRDKDEERIRQAEVAAAVKAGIEQAKEAAQRLIERQDELARQATEANVTAKLSLTANEQAAKSAELTNQQLVEVAKVTVLTHGLVNSQFSTIVRGLYDSTMRELALLHDMVELRRKDVEKDVNKNGGKEGSIPFPSLKTQRAITAAEARLVELQTLIDEMDKQAKMVAGGQAMSVPNEGASVPANPPHPLKQTSSAPVPVIDKVSAAINLRVAEATEKSADAAVTQADAAVRVAIATEDAGKKK